MGYPIFQDLYQARLPNPGLTTYQHHVAQALFDLGPAFQEHTDLVLSTNEGCEPSGGRDVQATLGPTLPQHAIDPEGRC
jgi:hypothetical protein